MSLASTCICVIWNVQYGNILNVSLRDNSKDMRIHSLYKGDGNVYDIMIYYS